MGLLDVLTGMRNGPRGHGGGGGMSPITMALLGLLAYKAVKNFGGAGPRAGSGHGYLGGGLGDLLKGGLVGAGLGGLGGILSGGLGDLVKQFQNAGKGDVADFLGQHGREQAHRPGRSQPGSDARSRSRSLPSGPASRARNLLAGLSEQLPKAVDELTPQGRLPAPQDVERAAGPS